MANGKSQKVNGTWSVVSHGRYDITSALSLQHMVWISWTCQAHGLQICCLWFLSWEGQGGHLSSILNDYCTSRNNHTLTPYNDVIALCHLPFAIWTTIDCIWHHQLILQVKFWQDTLITVQVATCVHNMYTHPEYIHMYIRREHTPRIRHTLEWGSLKLAPITYQIRAWWL